MSDSTHDQKATQPASQPQAGVPTDPGSETLTDITDRLDGDRSSGEGQFRAEADGMIRCLTCQDAFSAAERRADQLMRLEGATDPDDMLMVVPMVCGRCGASGSLVLGYGPNANADDEAVILGLDRRPGGATSRRRSLRSSISKA